MHGAYTLIRASDVLLAGPPWLGIVINDECLEALKIAIRQARSQK